MNCWAFCGALDDSLSSTYPLALMALATVPALAAIYILRNRFPAVQAGVQPRAVALTSSPNPAARKIHRLATAAAVFSGVAGVDIAGGGGDGTAMDIATVGAPAHCGAGRFIFHARGGRRRFGTNTRRSFLQKLFRRQPPPSTRFILAGAQPRSLGSTVKSWREVDELLPQWTCWSPNSAMDSAITLAAELGKQEAIILVLTDHKPADEKISNQRLEWHAFGTPLENVAIVNASRSVFGDQDRCLLEVANFSSTAHTTKLAVQIGTNAPQGSLVSLGAHESQRLVFNVSSAAPSLRAMLEPDALAEDNEIQLLPPIRQHVRVQVALTNEGTAALVNRTLEATGLRAAISDSPELVIRETDTLVSSNSLEPGHAGYGHDQCLHRPVCRG